MKNLLSGILGLLIAPALAFAAVDHRDGTLLTNASAVDGVAIANVSAINGQPSAPSGYSPSTDSTVLEWLPADGKLYNTGTTQATNGQTVATWVSSTTTGGSGQNATAPGGFQGTFTTNAKGSLPALLFNGGQAYTTGNFGTLTQPFVVWFAFQLSTTATYNTFYQDIGGGTYALTDPTPEYRVNAGSNGFVGTADTSWHVIEIIFNGASSTLTIDNGTPTSLGNIGSGTVSAGIDLGQLSGGGFQFSGYIGEVMFQNAIPSGPQTADIWTYMLNRW